MAKATVGDATQEPGEHLGRVADGFGRPELYVVFQERQRTATEALDANLKGNPSASRGLLVDGTDGQCVEREKVERHFVALFPQSLELNGPLENAFKIVVHIVDGKKVLDHAVSTARRLLSVVRSVLFVLNVGSEPVPCIAHATKQGLCEGQNVSETFFELGGQRG